MTDKCECQGTGRLFPDLKKNYHPTKELPFVNHAPGKCRCLSDIKSYWQGIKIIRLCSNCIRGEEVVDD